MEREVDMPIYEFFCPKCEVEFELMRPVSQSGKDGLCPRCGTAGRKLVSVFGSSVDTYTVKVPDRPAFRQKAAPARKKVR